jgi:phosphoserine phosphatase
MTHIQFIQNATQLPVKGIENTIALLNEDCTIPFISRYRKDQTVNLDEVHWWMEAVLQQDIVPRLFPQGQARLDWHRKRGDRIVLISASGEHIVKPIAQYMGIEDVIAINLAQTEG